MGLRAFDFTAQKLGLALANSVAITRPEAIVLFGGLAQAGELFVPTKKYMEENTTQFQDKIPLIVQHYRSRSSCSASALIWKTL